VTLRFLVRPPAAPGATLTERAVTVDAAAGELTLGRRAGVTLELPFPTVSSLHARIVREGGGWAVVDLGSANGTFVDDRRLAPHVACALRAGAVLRLADVSLMFEGERDVRERAESTATLARRLVADLFGASRPTEVARVTVAEGPDAGRAVALDQAGHVYRVGRARHCDLVLTDEDVSREHAAFERRWDGVVVRDLGSKNGVLVGGARIEGDRRVGDGEVVLLGATRVRVDDPEERYLARVQAEADAAAPDAPKSATPAPMTEAPPPAPVSGPTPPARARAPAALVVSVVAAVVLAAIVGVVLWLVLGRWQ
jgi:pSer/pThr/pTyr-binding forkhead associated (FHA) protein